MDKRICIQGSNVSINIDRFKRDGNTIWMYLDDNIVCNICLKFTNIRYYFISKDTNTIFYEVYNK